MRVSRGLELGGGFSAVSLRISWFDLLFHLMDSILYRGVRMDNLMFGSHFHKIYRNRANAMSVNSWILLLMSISTLGIISSQSQVSVTDSLF